MRPCFDFVVKSIPWAGAGTDVTVTVQFVRGGDVAKVHSALDQVLDCV